MNENNNQESEIFLLDFFEFINELAHAAAKATGYTGRIEFNPSNPEGAPRKWMSSERLNQLGWRPECHLEDGLGRAYLDFCTQQNTPTR